MNFIIYLSCFEYGEIFMSPIYFITSISKEDLHIVLLDAMRYSPPTTHLFRWLEVRYLFQVRYIVLKSLNDETKLHFILLPCKLVHHIVDNITTLTKIFIFHLSLHQYLGRFSNINGVYRRTSIIASRLYQGSVIHEHQSLTWNKWQRIYV